MFFTRYLFRHCNNLWLPVSILWRFVALWKWHPCIFYHVQSKFMIFFQSSLYNYFHTYYFDNQTPVPIIVDIGKVYFKDGIAPIIASSEFSSRDKIVWFRFFFRFISFYRWLWWLIGNILGGTSWHVPWISMTKH